MDIEYKIVGFDQGTGNITIEFGDITSTVVVPIVDGKFLVGEALTNYCDVVVGAIVKEREKLKNVENVEELKAMVDSTPPVASRAEVDTLIKRKLKITDFYFMPDYKISPSDLNKIIEYREKLRGLSRLSEYPNIILPDQPIVTKLG